MSSQRAFLVPSSSVCASLEGHTTYCGAICNTAKNNNTEEAQPSSQCNSQLDPSNREYVSPFFQSEVDCHETSASSIRDKPNTDPCWQHDPLDLRCVPSFRKANMISGGNSTSLTLNVPSSVKCTAICKTNHKRCTRNSNPNRDRCWQHDPLDPRCASSFRKAVIAPSGDGVSLTLNPPSSVKCAAICETSHRRCTRDPNPNRDRCWQHDPLDPKCAPSFRKAEIAPSGDKAQLDKEHCWQYRPSQPRCASSFRQPAVIPDRDSASVALKTILSTPSVERCTAIGSTTHKPCKRKAKPNRGRCWQHDLWDPGCAPAIPQSAILPSGDSISPSLTTSVSVKRCTAIGSSTHRQCSRNAKPDRERCWQHDPLDSRCAPSFRQSAIVSCENSTSPSTSTTLSSVKRCTAVCSSTHRPSEEKPNTDRYWKHELSNLGCASSLRQPAINPGGDSTSTILATSVKQLTRDFSLHHEIRIPSSLRSYLRDGNSNYSDYIPQYLHPLTQAALWTKMLQPLGNDQKSGFMYAWDIQGPKKYQDPEKVLLKVGQSVNPRERLRKWQRQCPTMEYTPRGCWPCSIRSSTAGTGDLLCSRDEDQWPLIFRVEQLVHLEIKDLVINAQHIQPNFPYIPQPTGLFPITSSVGKSRLGRSQCEDCGSVHQEIFPLARIQHGENKDREWEHVVKPMIGRWGRFVLTLGGSL